MSQRKRLFLVCISALMDSWLLIITTSIHESLAKFSFSIHLLLNSSLYNVVLYFDYPFFTDTGSAKMFFIVQVNFDGFVLSTETIAQ